MLDDVPGAGPHAGLWHDGSGHPWLITAHFALVEGRHEVVGLDITSATPEHLAEYIAVTGEDAAGLFPVRLTAELWRQVPLGALTAELRRRYVEALDESGNLAANPRAAALWQELPDPGAAWSLDQIAAAYVAAHARGDNPTRAVAEAAGLTRTAAAKRVARARAAGLLPPTRQGVPATTTKEGDRG